MPKSIKSINNVSNFIKPSGKLLGKNSIHDMDCYKKMFLESDSDYYKFWSNQAKKHILWNKIFTNDFDDSNKPHFKWFTDGILNVSENCLEYNLNAGRSNKLAIIFESDDGSIRKLTYLELFHKVCQFANGIKSLGFKKGDICIIYMPMSIEIIIAMQACARLGIIHSVVFGGFSSRSLQERIINIKASLVITADGQKRSGKTIPLKQAVDDAISNISNCSVKNVIVYKRTGEEINWVINRDLWMHDVSYKQDLICRPVPIESEHTLFVLYTSGSTGKPKGVQHSSAGYLLWAKMTTNWTFDVNDNDIFWCTADIGWITGHTYIAYGPLALGMTQIIFEGVPTYPNAARFWEIISRYKVTTFYTAPTVIRSLIKLSDTNDSFHPKNYNLSSLRIIGSVGEPINPDTWLWYYKHVGNNNCSIVDTWWQTETGGHMITPLPGITPMKPGSCTLPLPGIYAAVVDEMGNDITDNSGGFLVIKRPWPGMIRNIWGDSDRFKENYFPEELKGYYLAGDAAQIDSDGYFWIIGRIDDVLNVSGHRLGTMEIESALISHNMVSEAAVVGRNDDTTGEAVVAFVVLKNNILPNDEESKLIAQDLRNWVAKEIGPIAKPKDIRFGENLPKTRSGKIVRRLLKVIANGEEITQDISTLENSSVVDQLIKYIK